MQKLYFDYKLVNLEMLDQMVQFYKKFYNVVEFTNFKNGGFTLLLDDKI